MTRNYLLSILFGLFIFCNAYGQEQQERSISGNVRDVELKEPLKLTLDLPMLAGKTLDYFVDDKKGQPTKTTLKVEKQGRAKVTIQSNGDIILIEYVDR